MATTTKDLVMLFFFEILNSFCFVLGISDLELAVEAIHGLRSLQKQHLEIAYILEENNSDAASSQGR